MKADRPKQFLSLEGTPILVLTLRKFDASPLIDHIVIASPREAVDEVREMVDEAELTKPVTAIEGGERRQDSVSIAMGHPGKYDHPDVIGPMQEMLANVADFFDEEIETVLARFMTIIEPLLLVVMGIIIAGLLLALYMPLLQLGAIAS